LTELELKMILIDKMKRNKSIHKPDQQKVLYKALIDAYESDKVILDTFGDTITTNRRQNDEDDDEDPFVGSNWGSKRRRAGKELESTNKTIHTADDLEEPAPQEFNIGFTEDQHVEEASQLLDWFKKSAKPPTLDHD
nr:hypothetical protein [Tanacetum cinerariifolium]GFB50407.1 hypothetical protein [Tanacetum cinerariifolium]